MTNMFRDHINDYIHIHIDRDYLKPDIKIKSFRVQQYLNPTPQLLKRRKYREGKRIEKNDDLLKKKIIRSFDTIYCCRNCEFNATNIEGQRRVCPCNTCAQGLCKMCDCNG